MKNMLSAKKNVIPRPKAVGIHFYFVREYGLPRACG